MGAARWVVIGGALAAAAAALHVLLGPTDETRPVSGTDEGFDSTGEASPATGPLGGRDAGAGVPQEIIDDESREALRDLMRESVEADGGAGPAR